MKRKNFHNQKQKKYNKKTKIFETYHSKIIIRHKWISQTPLFNFYSLKKSIEPPATWRQRLAKYAHPNKITTLEEETLSKRERIHNQSVKKVQQQTPKENDTKTKTKQQSKSQSILSKYDIPLHKQKITSKRPSRRQELRTKKRKYKKCKKVKNITNSYLKQRLLQSNIAFSKICHQRYGVKATPLKTISQNVQSNLSNMEPTDLYNKFKNLSFHNLCENKEKIPPLTNKLLGLGHKFCIQHPLQKNHLKILT